MSMINRDHVREQYADETNLQIRMQVWHPTAEGRDPATEALAAVVEAAPQHVVEVGCGTGAFAARVAAALPHAQVEAVDQSPRMVELTSSRGIAARLGDATELPFDDASVDVVAALWMLYHVPDVDAALGEFSRVLRPGGRLVVVTNGDEHLSDLRHEAGGGPEVTGFSTQNGEAQIHRHFDEVSRTDLTTRAIFPHSDAALAYLNSTAEPVAWELEPFDAAREFMGETTVFVALKAS